jgi:hypothetical protein
MLAAGLAGFTQIEKDARSAIDAMTRDERRSNESKQPGVFLRAVRDRLLQPIIVAARGHFEDATHALDAVPDSMSLDEFVRRTDSSRDLVLGLRHRPSAKTRMLAFVH